MLSNNEFKAVIKALQLLDRDQRKKVMRKIIAMVAAMLILIVGMWGFVLHEMYVHELGAPHSLIEMGAAFLVFIVGTWGLVQHEKSVFRSGAQPSSLSDDKDTSTSQAREADHGGQ